MKLCIPIASPDGLEASLHADFGAAQYLLVIDSDTREFTAIDRARPETIAEETVSGIQGILCSEIHPRLLFELQHNGIQVFGCEADTAGAALALFCAGELEAAPPFDPHTLQGGEGHACGDHGDDHECCGGAGHADPDHECCGGKGHGEGRGGGGCGGGGHGHGRQGGGCGCGG
ncbi:MAG: hypothetical protein BSR46_05480 [Candidatus Dactylopiibacterium carminicum]|uniref:NifB/NifX family molybdenum-iron cluster-binding protein n=1 Tax=Candidatus Dactylopiibacterium carminicum TaxID=857335 RepID=UPI000BCDC176|nr:hypothetical protein [Candidatus Dactylopiibacterium carminicum]PAS99897.1 MAG: hypothetical protein BSR46_05480 [Candidatus Dactylopiibacterium carminicum]